MSDRAACPKCGGPVSPAVKVCPHCGHGRGTGGSLADVKLSREEARALLTMTGPSADGAPRPLGWFVLAHPELHGGAAAVERVTTVLSAPLWAPGFVSVLLMGRRRFDRGGLAGGEASVGIVLGLVGLLTLWPVAGWLFGAAATPVLAIAGGAWAVRSVLRYRATQRRSRALSELDRPATLPAPVAPVASAAPAPVDAAPLADGPRRLR